MHIMRTQESVVSVLCFDYMDGIRFCLKNLAIVQARRWSDSPT